MVSESNRGGRWAGADDGPTESRPGRSTSRLARHQIIDRILELNPSATTGFLDRFSDQALAVYLEHLVSAQQPRGRDAVWERPGDSPAIIAGPPVAFED